MKMEKNIIALSILALVIGITTIIPLAYFTDNNMAAAGQSWFKVDIPYAYIDLYDIGENAVSVWDGAHITVLANFTLTPDTLKLKDGEAKISFYMFHIYSEQGSIANISSSIAISGRTTHTTRDPPYFESVINGGGNQCFYFADGTMYNGSAIVGGIDGSSISHNSIPWETPIEYIITEAGTFISNYDNEFVSNYDVEALATLRNSQTICITVSRIGSVSYQEGTEQKSSTTTVTLVNEVLGYIELTRIDDDFICGKYVEGTLPWPVRVPTSASLILQSTPIYKLKPFMPTYERQSITSLIDVITTRGH
jgi:hypothetical protein